MLENYSEIRLLPAELRNQIAAGEVVERPCSVVKELVENSLDAGATQIDICIENGGQSLIRVQDNGWGIASEQLELAITRHATSKISCMDDLDSINSYGFRGEALPSIASVSRFRIASRAKSASRPEGLAVSLEVEHGVITRKSGDSLPQGTLVEVRDLFASTPARLKFLKSPSTELKKSQTWMTRLALASLETGYSFSAGEREILRFLPGEDLRMRLSKIWPLELVEELLQFKLSIHGMDLEGLAAPPQLRQPKPDRMLFYVNGRAINDKRLMAAVKEAYKGRIISKDYPQLVLFININPKEIDVNAHPAKTEVRFRNESILFSAVSAALGQAFQQMPGVGKAIFEEKNFFHDAGGSARAVTGLWPEFDPPIIHGREKSPVKGEWEVTFNEFEDDGQAAVLREMPTPFHSQEADNLSAELEKSAPLLPTSRPSGYKGIYGSDNVMYYMGQVADTYLVVRDGTGALLLLDQHAAHERVLFHRFSTSSEAKGINLIIPLELRLNADQKNLLNKLLGNLEALGFRLRLDSGKLIVKSIPSLLTRGEARDFLQEVLAESSENPERLYISMACRGAIKAGQKLSPDEAYELLRQWQDTPLGEFCPHGRPCVLRWDVSALEKLFKRR